MKRTIAFLAIALHVPLASAVYRCVDERGLALFGDTPPAGCANVPMYEMSRTGKVLRRIDPTPTPEQLKVLQEQQEKRKAEQKAAAEQKRQDMALLGSYDSAKEFEVARVRNLEPVQGRIAASEKRLKELDGHEKDVTDRMEFYKGGKARRGKPAGNQEDPNLVWFNGELERVRAERAMLVQALARERKEIGEITARFEANKRRWILLKSGKLAVGSIAPAEPVAAAAKPGKPGY